MKSEASLRATAVQRYQRSVFDRDGNHCDELEHESEGCRVRTSVKVRDEALGDEREREGQGRRRNQD